MSDEQALFVGDVLATGFWAARISEITEEDTVLTLSTCCRKYDKANSGNQRLVVMAKLLPEGATAQEFSVSLVDSPEMP